MNLTTLGTTYKWNPTVFIFLRLAYFTWHHVLKVHWCCSMYQNFFSFYGWIMFCCKCIQHFVLSIHPSMNAWVASLFWLLWIKLLWTWMNKAHFDTPSLRSLPLCFSVLARWWAVMWQCLMHPYIPLIENLGNTGHLNLWLLNSLIPMHYIPQRFWTSIAACYAAAPACCLVLTFLQHLQPSWYLLNQWVLLDSVSLAALCNQLLPNLLALTWKLWLRLRVRLSCWIIFLYWQ